MEGTLEEVKDIAEKFNDFSNLFLYFKGFLVLHSFFFFSYNKDENLSRTKSFSPS